MSIIKYLKNSPCGEDLFEGKSQDTIAKNIAEILANNTSTKIIGIDGGWGSGKSNVVYQVETILKDKYHFFIYDAWGHQEDLQRRAVLEELTDNLIKSKLLPNSWINKLKSLLAKKRETTTQTIPNLSIGIILSAFAIIISPLFKTLSDVLGSRHICWRILITSIPFLVIFITYLYYVCTERGLLKGLKKMYFIYKDKQKEDTTFETISEAEPSVVKFREWMTHLSKDLIGKKLVIVFDNMDRLPQKKVQELWSSIHVFFAETPYDNIRVIIPFDREHIKSAFKNEDMKNEECFGNDFIDKTFDVVFRVSPPIMTDWKNYFTLKWEEAFGSKENSTDFERVTQIYDLIVKDITPRKIIAFINEFVSIKTSLNSYNIPDRYIALFILGKEDITTKPLQEIITPTYLSGVDFLYRSDEDLPKYIASLFYQVDPERANQVVFTDKLKRALDNFDRDNLETISKIPNFYSLLENAIVSISNIDNASYSINILSKEKILNNIQLKHIWECIYRKVEKTTNNYITEGQLTLLDNIVEKENYAFRLIEDIKNSPTFDAIKYADSIKLIDPIYKVPNDKLKEIIVSVDQFISFVNNKKEDWDKYKIGCNKDDLNNYFISNTDKLTEMTFVQYIKNKYDINWYINELEYNIPLFAESNSIDLLVSFYNSYKLVSEKHLKLVLKDELIYTLFAQNPSPKSNAFFYDLVAMRISKLDNFVSSYANIFEPILQNNDTIAIENISKIIEYYIDLDNLLLGLKTFYIYPLYKSIVKYLIETNLKGSKLLLAPVLKEYNSICELGELNGEKLLRLLNNWNYQASKNINNEFICKYTSVKLISDCLLVKNELTEHITKTLINHFNYCTTEQWKVFIKDRSSFEFQALQLLDEYKYPQQLIDAVKEMLYSIAKEETPIPDKETWNNIIVNINKQERKLLATFNTIRDIFCSNANINPELFNFFGDWLFEYAKLDSKKEILRTIFKSDIIRVVSTLELMMSKKDIMKKIVEDAEEEADEFKEYFISLASQNGNEKIKEFATYIGIEFPIKEKDDKDESK